MSAQEMADFIDIDVTAEAPVDPDRGIPEWDATAYDFGEVQEGDTVVYDFVITNRGKKPFLITGSKTDCGCTVPTYEDKPIEAGASEVIQVRFASDGRSGSIDKKVSIFTNVKPHHHTLRLSGEVISTTTQP
jgi:hypothetical protein